MTDRTVPSIKGRREIPVLWPYDASPLDKRRECTVGSVVIHGLKRLETNRYAKKHLRMRIEEVNSERGKQSIQAHIWMKLLGS
jgi:hypothetical protein